MPRCRRSIYADSEQDISNLLDIRIMLNPKGKCMATCWHKSYLSVVQASLALCMYYDLNIWQPNALNEDTASV